ncbi:MATE family efflux transporter [Halomarina ordinaria]|uniref:Multidrug-efflux transporter n=1 Tax=Halomarina ordinaria TaxID=3033939 RepID=A0ABD5U888_9EURY|nr:MATE family efflux transporter [Halomarina sp. PSRA2]
MSPARDSITEGGLARPLFTLAWPIVVTELLQVAYNVADTLWLGQLSAAAVAAMSIAFPLIFLFLSIGGGFTVAGSILVAQYTGADSDDDAGKIAGQTLSFITLLAVAIAVVGYLATGPLLALIPTDPETAVDVVPLAEEYMRVFFLGTPFMFGFFVFSALMRGYGDTRTPMRVMFLSVALNVALDPVFIFGFEANPLFGVLGLAGVEAALFEATGFAGMGVAGAALATLLSRLVAMGVGFYLILATGAGPAVSLGHLRPDLDAIRKIVRIGVPSALEQSTSALAMITLTVMVATFPTATVAAYGLGNRLVSLVFLPAMGLGRATDTMVGQNLGAGKDGRAERAVHLAAGTGAGVMLVVAGLAFVAAEPVVNVFIGERTPEALRTIDLGAEYLRIRTVEFAFIGVLQVLLGAYRGAGKTRTALAFSMVALWLGRVPTVYYLAFVADMGATGIWIGMALGNVVGAVAAGAWFLRGTWKQRVVDVDVPSRPEAVGDGED